MQGISWLGCLFEEWELMGAAAKELKGLAKGNTYSFFFGIGKFFYGRYLFEQGRSAEAEEEMSTGYEKYVLYEGGCYFSPFKLGNGANCCSAREKRKTVCFSFLLLLIFHTASGKAVSCGTDGITRAGQAALGDKDAAKAGLKARCPRPAYFAPRQRESGPRRNVYACATPLQPCLIGLECWSCRCGSGQSAGES